jgi:hypothetical protein
LEREIVGDFMKCIDCGMKVKCLCKYTDQQLLDELNNRKIIKEYDRMKENKELNEAFFRISKNK